MIMTFGVLASWMKEDYAVAQENWLWDYRICRALSQNTIKQLRLTSGTIANVISAIKCHFGIVGKMFLKKAPLFNDNQRITMRSHHLYRSIVNRFLSAYFNGGYQLDMVLIRP
jgi:hypothetical protein